LVVLHAARHPFASSINSMQPTNGFLTKYGFDMEKSFVQRRGENCCSATHSPPERSVPTMQMPRIHAPILHTPAPTRMSKPPGNSKDEPRASSHIPLPLLYRFPQDEEVQPLARPAPLPGVARARLVAVTLRDVAARRRPNVASPVQRAVSAPALAAILNSCVFVHVAVL